MSTVYCPYCFRHQILSVCFHDLKPSHPISFHYTVELEYTFAANNLSLPFEFWSDHDDFNDTDSGSGSKTQRNERDVDPFKHIGQGRVKSLLAGV